MKIIIKTLLEIAKTKGFLKWFVPWTLIYLAGVVVYVFGCDAGVLESLYHSFKLFTFSVNPALGGNEAACNDILIYGVAFVAASYTSWGILYIAIKRFLHTKRLFSTLDDSYILVFGLGDKAASYIDSELQRDSDVKILVVEYDANNPNIEKYRKKGVALKIADARSIDVLRELHLSNARHMLALTGNSVDNLEIALGLKAVFMEENIPKKDLYMRMDDYAISKFYKDGGLLDDSSNLIIHMFSMAQNSARELFERYGVDGQSMEYMNSDKPFGIIIAGASQLALEVIGQICELAHLPNENHVTIYCIDKDAKKFEQLVMQRYTQIKKIVNVSIEYISLDKESREFYTDDVWHQELTQIILAYPDSSDNLSIATELSDSTYLPQIQAKTLKPRIHIAVYENRMIAKEIERNEKLYGYFDTFANTEKMASREMILDEKLTIAKCIHLLAYDKPTYDPKTTFATDEEILKAWQNIDNINDRPSNLSQAYHLPLKLKALGLSCAKSDKKSYDEIIMHNRTILNAKLGKELKSFGLDDDALREKTKDFDRGKRNVEKFDYFPEKFELLVEKLMRAEHNRWNAFHYLRGWVYSEIKDKNLKEHNCLVELKDLPKDMRYTVLFDLYAILLIPNLLAKVGYEIVIAE